MSADQKPTPSHDLISSVMRETLGSGMHNAVHAQMKAQALRNDATSKACASLFNTSSTSPFATALDEAEEPSE